MEEFDEQALKRLIRVMNSVLNLYDVEGIPVEVIDYLYYPVGNLSEALNIPVKWRKNSEGKNEIDKFIMPEDFDVWLESDGEVEDS